MCLEAGGPPQTLPRKIQSAMMDDYIPTGTVVVFIGLMLACVAAVHTNTDVQR